jgi:hypothetical protein
VLKEVLLLKSVVGSSSEKSSRKLKKHAKIDSTLNCFGKSKRDVEVISHVRFPTTHITPTPPAQRFEAINHEGGPFRYTFNPLVSPRSL